MKGRPSLSVPASALLLLALVYGCSVNDVARRSVGLPAHAEASARRAELQESFSRSSVLIVPVYFAAGDQWGPADALGDRLRPFAASVVVRSEPPEIGGRRSSPTSYRYMPVRLKQYRTWLEKSDVGADYLFVAEIYTERVERGQLMVFDRRGRLVHSASVHWGGGPPTSTEDAAERLVTRFVTDLGLSIRG